MRYQAPRVSVSVDRANLNLLMRTRNKEIADIAAATNLTYQTIWHITRGKRTTCDIDTALKISKFLDIRFDDAFILPRLSDMSSRQNQKVAA